MTSLIRKLLPRRLRDDLRQYIGDAVEGSLRQHFDRISFSRTAADPKPDVSDESRPESKDHKTQLAEIEAKIIVLHDRLTELVTHVGQLSYVLSENNLPPPPPRHLQERVVGGYVPRFLESGFDALRDIDAALAPSGHAVSGFRRILDFGCGCGRLIRALKSLVPEARLSGTDIDPEAIAWLQRNYSRFGEFSLAPHRPPTSYPADTFDFIYGVSVLSHLPEEMQFQWLGELQRVLQPGGYLVLSVHGEKHWRSLPEKPRAQIETHGFYYGDLGWNYGRSVNLPDFYQTAYHHHDYIRREWGRYFLVVDIQALRMDLHQDTVLMQKRV